MLAVVDGYGPAGAGFEVSSQFTVEVRSRTGRRWDYSSGTGVCPLDPNVGELRQWFDCSARDHFEDLLIDLRRDGFDGPHPPAGYDIVWEITDAARETQRRCDATPLDQRPVVPEPIYVELPESGPANQPILTWHWKRDGGKGQIGGG